VSRRDDRPPASTNDRPRLIDERSAPDAPSLDALDLDALDLDALDLDALDLDETPQPPRGRSLRGQRRPACPLGG
jgi:hypothetical protein